jgi:transcriptional regulator with XRE-family HTH domain
MYTFNGQRLRQAREEKGYSQRELAEKLNTKQPYISKLEKGLSEGVMFFRLGQLADVLGLQVSEMIIWSEERERVKPDGTTRVVDNPGAD